MPTHITVDDTIDGDKIPAMSATKKGGAPATGTPTGKYLKDDGTWGTIAGGGDMTKAVYDPDLDNVIAKAQLDASLANTSGTNTGDQSAIPNSALATMLTKTYKGRTAGTTGVPEDVAVATLKTDLVLVKADVGLGSVDNTTDSSKPIFTLTQTALDNKLDDTQFSGLAKITVGITQPSSPSVGDLWIDTN